MTRNFPRLLAHLFERTGLALIGAAAGLFVGIQTGASIPVLTNTTFLLVMTLVGATGFYLASTRRRIAFRALPSICREIASTGKSICRNC